MQKEYEEQQTCSFQDKDEVLASQPTEVPEMKNVTAMLFRAMNFKSDDVDQDGQEIGRNEY